MPKNRGTSCKAHVLHPRLQNIGLKVKSLELYLGKKPCVIVVHLFAQYFYALSVVGPPNATQLLAAKLEALLPTAKADAAARALASKSPKSVPGPEAQRMADCNATNLSRLLNLLLSNRFESLCAEKSYCICIAESWHMSAVNTSQGSKFPCYRNFG